MSSPARLRPVSSPPAAARTAVRTSRARGVVAQVRVALQPRARLATTIGAVLGGFVPCATWQVAHHELTGAPLWRQFGTLLVLGGLTYSASTVYTWGRQAFKSKPKAVGFVVLLEGVLIGSSTTWLGLMALVVLAGVNAIATGATLSNDDGP